MQPADRETIKVLCELIEEQMDLEKNTVAIYNQKRMLTPKTGIWIDVAILGFKVFQATSRPENDPSDPDLLEIQTVGQQEIYQIDIMSADDSARMRKIEIIMALTGVTAQQACEKYAMKISAIPASFVDVSQVEASARLNRYAITITVLRSYSKARRSPAFTVFQNPPKSLLVNP